MISSRRAGPSLARSLSLSAALVVIGGLSGIGCAERTKQPDPDPKPTPQQLDEQLHASLAEFIDQVTLAVGPRRVVLQGFYDAETGTELRMSKYITPWITRELGRRGVKIVERDDLDKVVDEQLRQGSDLFRPEAQQRLGKLVGAEVLLLCPVTRPGQRYYRSDWKITDVANGTVDGAGSVTIDRRLLPPRYGGTL